ncbi:putative uncharacterized protein MYH16 [Xenia sp. Carnegie-2017]|uniref:putative uncharacterized protein MYH16 n=1 Tax=Xenia sp. Carnegie-2017 TaxID=2897299 RepID=UPI001F0414B7|nr:putative uncharacterized protein MYH16 [Xenia sp. Carnegie-2017]
MADYGTLQEELMKCREEMNEVQLNAADLKDRVRHLEQDRQTLKRQRDGAFTARREAILDRDKAFLERDQAFRKCNEIKERQDAAIEEKILQLKNFDEIVARCDVMEEEINHVKMKYRQTLRQLHEMKGKYGIEEDQLNEISRDKEQSVISQCEINITNDLKKEAQGNLPVESGNTKRSSSNTIVESIKRRVTSPSTLFGNPDPPNFPTSPVYMGSSLPRTEHMVYPFLHSHRSPTSPLRDATSKEGGLDRKGLTRMPIKMKQNGRDDTVSRWSSNESLGQSSTLTEEHTEEATFTTSSATIMHNGEHERVQRVNGDENESDVFLKQLSRKTATSIDGGFLAKTSCSNLR